MLNREILVVPSILAANFAHLREDVTRAESAKAKMLHLDIMDGHFVPNISFGPSLVKTVNGVTDLPLDTHLMIENPDMFLEQFKDAGSDILTVHVEACPRLRQTIAKIKALGLKAGVSLNPATSLSTLTDILPYVDLVLVMSVNPGFGGQKFIETSVQKISELSAMIKEQKLPTVIEVDGGIDTTTITKVISAGAHYLVAGNAVFGDGNIENNFERLNSYTK